MNAATTSRFHSETLAGFTPEVGEPEVDVELEQVDPGGSLCHAEKRGTPSDGTPGGLPSPHGNDPRRPCPLAFPESPEAAVELLLGRGYSACELDFESGFWLDYPGAERLGELARANDIALSVHALFAFPGHPDPRKSKQALGALDRTAGLAASCGAELVVIHPGFWPGRDRDTTLDDVVTWLVAPRERLEAKGRALPFGLEVMGRVSELGSIDDVVDVAGRLGWVRPVVDFAHMHATTDGAFTDVDAFAEALESADAVLERARRSTSISRHIAFANRNETKHLLYGEGTLRADPLRAALDRFERPATGHLRVTRRGLVAGDQGRARGRDELDGDELGVAGELVVDRVRLADPAAVEEAGQRREQLAAPIRSTFPSSTATASRRSPSASSSRLCAARTRPSAIRVVARDTLSCGPHYVSRASRA